VSSCGWRARRVAAAILSATALAVSPAAADGEGEQAPPEEGAQIEHAGEPVSAFEENAARAFDVFPIRVLSACAAVVGFGAFIATAPLVAPFGRLEAIRNSWDYFVVGPYDYTFVRPLGDF
jgi:hypothetical protein